MHRALQHYTDCRVKCNRLHSRVIVINIGNVSQFLFSRKFRNFIFRQKKNYSSPRWLSFTEKQKWNSVLFSISNSVCELDPAQEIFTETEGAETEWHTNSLTLVACESVICSLKIFSKLLILVFSSVVLCHALDQTTYYEEK
jgi:hypothetical protein